MNSKKYNFFGKKLPAWLLLAALVIVGAGAATGLVLKDQITGTTTIAVSQALRVDEVTGTSWDAFLGTVNDDGMSWAAHIEANNGDIGTVKLDIYNYGDQDIHAIMELDVPEGITVSVAASGDLANAVEIANHVWKFKVNAAADGTTDLLTITLALEDAQPTGFYEIVGVIYPVNV